MNLEFLRFLVPRFDEGLQTAFFVIIVLMLAGSCVALQIGAREARWDARWRGPGRRGTSDELDVEHGSVNDISTAVATWGERSADVMPGIMLVIGLLGTFIGLGLTLDRASAILSAQGSGSGDMDQTFQQLMGVMQGLGTKFKTSTWGILAFLLLKAFGAINGHDTRRLGWAVRKMNEEVDRRRAGQEAAARESTDRIVAAITQASSDARAESNRNHSQAMDANEQWTTGIVKAIEASTQATSVSIKSLGQAQRAAIEQHESSATRLIRLLTTHRADQQSEGERLLSGVDGVSATVLETVQRDIAPGMVAIRALLHVQAGLHSQRSDEQMGLLTRQASASEKILKVLGGFADAQSSAMASMTAASQGMEKSIGGVNEAAGALKKSVESLDERLAGTLDRIGDRLIASTGQIAAAVERQSNDVNSLLNEVKLETSKALQMATSATVASTKASAQLDLLATKLSKSVGEMTLTMEETGEEIKHGLAAVSKNALQLEDHSKRLLDLVAQMEKMANSLAQLPERLQNEGPRDAILRAILLAVKRMEPQPTPLNAPTASTRLSLPAPVKP